MKRLQEIQSKLKAPKNQYNKFGEYYYRSCEDILEAVKPLLKEQGLILTISDEVIEVGNRNYIKATASIYDDTKLLVQVSANAREMLEKKKMDDCQITGATSSYARKYALNGLFCIDDVKDADATNKHGKINIDDFVNEINSATTVQQLIKLYSENKEIIDNNKQILDLLKNKKAELKG